MTLHSEAGARAASEAVGTTTNDRYALGGYALAAAGALLFSIKGILVKLAYLEGVDAETLLALRMAITLPVYILVGLLAVRAAKTNGSPLPNAGLVLKAALVGILGYWASGILDFKGLELITAQFERLILFTYPLFVVLIGAAFFGQRVNRNAILAFLVSYAGLALVFTRNLSTIGESAILGGAFVLAAAITFALYQILAKGLIGAIGSSLFTCIAMFAAALAAVLHFVAIRPLESAFVSPYVFGLAFTLAIGGTVVPAFLLNAALQRISAQMNAVIGMLSPIATIALAVVFLSEPLNTVDLAGAALVIAGIGAFSLASRR